MRIDWYTKAVLTVIALALVVLVFQKSAPSVSAQAGRTFTNVDAVSNTSYFDRSTGDMYTYDQRSGAVMYHYRITQLGQPMQIITR